MKLSHIICSRNRASQLKITLSKLDPHVSVRKSVEFVLVDSASEDATIAIMEAFARKFPTQALVVRADRAGLTVARNLGVRTATGDLLAFTDDDCYLDKNYYESLLNDFDFRQHQYGTGQSLLWDPSDDNRIAIRTVLHKATIQPRSLLPAGMIQGCNMFFLREVFERIGYFSEDLGGGTPFACDDIEFATRASVAGFTGVLLPNVIIYHHHSRKPGSPESVATLSRYDAGRGAYYAILLMRGIHETWHLWSQLSASNGTMPLSLVARLEREFRGAADYLRYCQAKQPDVK